MSKLKHVEQSVKPTDLAEEEKECVAEADAIGAGIPEKTAMLISGHKTRSMFDRYTIIDERDIELAGQKLEAFETLEKEVRAGEGKRAEEATGNVYTV
jgi:hypothetical protein